MQDEGEWKIWLLRTILNDFKGLSFSIDVLEPGATKHVEEEDVEQNHFDCIIVGAGLSGLSVAGRLKALGVSYVVLEKNAEVGDNWRKRYDSAKCKF